MSWSPDDRFGQTLSLHVHVRVKSIYPAPETTSDATQGEVETKRRLMDILACPIDKHYPLDLHVFEEKEEIVEGLLVCSKCDRWYPISDEIPQLLPDDLRESNEDLRWLAKWKDRVPERVLTVGKPFSLK